jgi:hypothetical protein
MIKKLKTKQDFVKALNQSEIKFLEEREIVSDQDIRALTDKIKTLIAVARVVRTEFPL